MLHIYVPYEHYTKWKIHQQSGRHTATTCGYLANLMFKYFSLALLKNKYIRRWTNIVQML